MISIKISGLDKLIRNMKNAPAAMKEELELAMGQSIEMIEGESKRRAPLKTGILRSSIGGTQGWKNIKPFISSVGTNVKYAWLQHEGNFKHRVGEKKYMEKGAKASESYVEKRFNQAIEKLAKGITK